jgi:hypothetical protein
VRLSVPLPTIVVNVTVEEVAVTLKPLTKRVSSTVCLTPVRAQLEVVQAASDTANLFSAVEENDIVSRTVAPAARLTGLAGLKLVVTPAGEEAAISVTGPAKPFTLIRVPVTTAKGPPLWMFTVVGLMLHVKSVA